MNPELGLEVAQGIATITFDRPRLRNAINLAMWEMMPEIMATVTRDSSVRAVVFRGAGERAFASGADISEFERVRMDPATVQAYNKTVDAAIDAILACPKPTVAMIYGYCVGGGMGLAMAMDLRFAADTARFGIPAARLGIIYGLKATRILVHLVGPARAKEILFSGRTFDAQEAAEMGFVNRVLPAGALDAYTLDVLRKMTANAPLSIRGAKTIIDGVVSGDFETEEIRELILESFDSQDYREGVRAFLEKRSPRFEGR